MKKNLLIGITCVVLTIISTNFTQAKPRIEFTQSHESVDADSVLTKIRVLGNLVYDHPQIFLKKRDSLLRVTYALHPKKAKEFTAYQLLLLNMGYALSQDAQILKSIEVYEKALALYYKHPQTPINFLEYYVKPLGSLYTMSGNIQHAIFLQRTALQKAKADAEEKAAVYANLAITIKELKRYDSVIAVCHRGLRYTTPTSLTAARHYNELADSFLTLKHIDSARYYNQKALQILDHPEVGQQRRQAIVWKANAWGIHAQIGWAQENYNKTAAGLTKALHLLENHFPDSHFRERAKLYELQGDLYVQYKHYQQAILAFTKSISLLKPKAAEVYPDYTVTYSFTGLGKAYTGLKQPNKAIHYYLKAILNDFLVQQFITTKKSSYYNSARNRETLQTVSDLLYKQFQKTSDLKQRRVYAFQLLWATELSKGRQLMNAKSQAQQWNADTTKVVQVLQVQEKLRYLYQRRTETHSGAEQKKINAAIDQLIYEFALTKSVFERQYQQPNYTEFVNNIEQTSQQKAILSWQINRDNPSYLIRISKGKIHLHRFEQTPIVAQRAEQFSQKYFYAGPQSYNNNPGQYNLEAQKLLTQLVPSIAHIMQKDWLLSPDGFIYDMPLGALIFKNRYLTETHRLREVYTLLHHQTTFETLTNPEEVLLFAKAKHDSSFVDLPYINQEIKAIATQVKTRVYRGDSTNFKNFQRALNTPNIIHISTHAVAKPGKEPFLVLHDKVSLDQLRLVLTQAPLVVLSACETEKGKLITGEGVESLNKAFISKGVGGVVAARWAVSDAFIPQFMGQFYKELKVLNDPTKALRKTQLYFINQPNQNLFQNPWFWASLNYTGAAMHLNLATPDKSESGNWWVFTGISSVLVVLMVIIVENRKKRRRL